VFVTQQKQENSVFFQDKITAYDLSSRERRVVTETGVTQPGEFSTKRSLTTVHQHTWTRRTVVAVDHTA